MQPLLTASMVKWALASCNYRMSRDLNRNSAALNHSGI